MDLVLGLLPLTWFQLTRVPQAVLAIGVPLGSSRFKLAFGPRVTVAPPNNLPTLARPIQFAFEFIGPTQTLEDTKKLVGETHIKPDDVITHKKLLAIRVVQYPS